MSIIDTFDNKSDEILKPSCISAPVEGFPDTVIITFKHKIINLLKDMYEVHEISHMHAPCSHPKSTAGLMEAKRRMWGPRCLNSNLVLKVFGNS
jgi:hypothetical protein